MRETEHEYIVEMPEGLDFADIIDFNAGWFRAQVQIIVCKDCGDREVGWRPFSEKRQDWNHEPPKETA